MELHGVLGILKVIFRSWFFIRVDFGAEVDCRSQSLSRTEIKTYAGEEESVRTRRF